MHSRLKDLLQGRTLLIAVAAPAEARAVLTGLGRPGSAVPPDWTAFPVTSDVDVVVTGVGKSLAAGGVARTLDPLRHAAIVSVGIAGTYGPAPLLSVVAADRCVFADEGVRTPTGFTDMAALGFGPTPQGMGVPTSPRLLTILQHVANHTGPIATVSTCSGTDDLAHEVASRTGAIAEAMEGAAVALVAQRLRVPAGELRVISNTTGDRARQEWRLAEALSRLSLVIGGLCGPNAEP